MNSIIAADDHLRVRHMYNVSFPEGGKTVAMVFNGRENILLDWKQKQVLWTGKGLEGASSLEFCQASKADAVLKDGNLYVVDETGKAVQLSPCAAAQGLLLGGSGLWKCGHSRRHRRSRL